MTKGVRAATVAKFNELLPLRAEHGNTVFRKSVISEIMTLCGVTQSSASTHYNFALKEARKANPAAVEGLGRPPEKNNGGRKPIHVVDVIKSKDGEVVATGLSRAAAQLLIERAAAAGKETLEIRVTAAADTADNIAEEQSEPSETAAEEPALY